jgi:amino acid transporter
MDIRALLLGRPLSNREAAEEKIGVAEGIPAMGLDGLSSAAYGPEAALTILIPLGAGGVLLVRPIMLAILGLLGILYLSYLQTIKAYPVNGGSYTVAKENLGANTGILAATALMLDYALNVAVGISAGIGALISAVPELQPYTLLLCLAVLLVITIVNLRGTLEAGLAFSLPTYLFVASFFAIIGIGLAKAVMAGGHPQPAAPLPPLRPAAEALGLWILLRAFSAGCTAMTGIEAVSNGVTAFREPTLRHAQRTLTGIVAILAVLLAGVAYLTGAYGIGAMDQTQPGYQSVLSQLAMAVVGRNAFYYVAIGSVLAVLSLSANTSFVGFPRLCRLVAQDDFLPRAFTHVGRRLVNTVGILFLTAFAGLLLIAFGGVTDRLIPLFAVGAFLSFSLAQAGMARHWHRQLAEGQEAPRERRGIRLRMAVNGFGALATGTTLLVIVAAKFVEGAWITVLVIPLTLLLLKAVKREYEREARALRAPGPLELQPSDPPVVLIPTENWNRLTDKAIRFALRLSPDVTAVHLTKLSGPESDDHERDLRRQWAKDVEEPAAAAGFPPPRLVLVRSPYRRFLEPLLDLVEAIRQRASDRAIAILIPELIKCRWWEHLLHTHRAQRLRSALLRRGGTSLVVITVPWYLDEPQIGHAPAAGGEVASIETRRAARLAKGVEIR